VTGEAEAIGEEGSQFHAQDMRNHARLVETLPIPTQREAITRIGKFLDDSGASAPVAIGHRVVHGGPKLRQHRLIVREAICAGLGWAGIVIEDRRENPFTPRRGVCVLPSQEDEQIARHTRAFALHGLSQ